MRAKSMLISLCCTVGPAVASARASEAVKGQPPELEAVRRAFVVVASKVYAEILPLLSAENRLEMQRVLGCDDKDCAEKAAEFLVTSSAAFTTTEVEAKAILSGSFDDEANAKKARASAEYLSSLGVSLPFLFTHLIKRVESREIQAGIELEFAARLLAHVHARAQRVADASLTGR